MSAQKNKQMDMLNGPLLKKILFFALPLAASSIVKFESYHSKSNVFA